MGGQAQFLVKRKGLGCHEYGLVDSRVAKRQRLQPLPAADDAVEAAAEGAAASEGAAAAATATASPAASPVSLQMVNEYEVCRQTLYLWADKLGRQIVLLKKKKKKILTYPYCLFHVHLIS